MSRMVEAAEPAASVPSALRRAFASFALLGESPVAMIGVGLIGEQRPGERRLGVRANHRGGFGACGRGPGPELADLAVVGNDHA